MINYSIKFSEYPASVKNSILFLCSAWAFHYLYYFKYLIGKSSQKEMYFMITIGILICYFVASINKWARAMCIFFNIAIIAMYLYLAWVYFTAGNNDLLLLTGLIAVLFTCSSYFLLQKDATEYFKNYNGEENDEKDDSDLEESKKE